jgi:hypothetical protein
MVMAKCGARPSVAIAKGMSIPMSQKSLADFLKLPMTKGKRHPELVSGSISPN